MSKQLRCNRLWQQCWQQVAFCMVDIPALLQVRDISTNEAWQDAMHLSVPVLAVLNSEGQEVSQPHRAQHGRGCCSYIRPASKGAVYAARAGGAARAHDQP